MPYVAAADGATVATDENGRMIYGRCDRENNCGYQLYPSGKKTDGIKPVAQPAPHYIRFIPAAVETDTNTALYRWACTMVGEQRARTAWYAYHVGNDHGRTLFWQIDAHNEVRGGKSIPYKTDGHRDHDDKYPALWLHKSKAWTKYMRGDTLEQCFFGEHLLPTRPDAPVAIVESEKTALLLSQYSRKYVWLACGGAGMLQSDDRNKALQGRSVTLFPDNGQYFRWAKIARQNGWQIADQIEKYPVFKGCDILDMIEAGAFGNDLIVCKKETTK